MTVLWIDLLSEMGGAQHSLLEVCSTLPSLGVDVVAAVPQGPLFDRLTAAGIKTFPVAAVRAKKRGWGLFTTTAKLLRAPSTISQIVRAVKPDLIHANSLTAFMSAHHIGMRTPVIWHVRDLKLPVLLARDASKKATRIFAASDAIDEYLVDILSPRILGRIRIIRNGIDTGRFAPGDKAAARQRFGLAPDVPVVGMLAHLIPWKRHDAFIQAAALIRRQRPDACFVAAGKDLFNEHARWRAQLDAQIQESGLANSFRWITDLDATETLLPALDLLLHPAQFEPFGRVLCEAMAARIPVIAAQSAGPVSIIQSGVSGILVRDGDPQLMAAEALKLLADPARAAQIAEAGRARVLKEFTTRRVCEQCVKEYRASLASISVYTGHDDE